MNWRDVKAHRETRRKELRAYKRKKKPDKPMTTDELNLLVRPYLMRQQARREMEWSYSILAALLFCILATAFGLTLAFVLNS